MAILDKITNMYFKIDFDKSSIIGSSVYPAYIIYKTRDEREKEKTRQKAVEQFLQNLDSVCLVEEKLINAEMERLGITIEQAVDSEGNVKTEYPILLEKQNKLIRLSKNRQVIEYFYVYGDDPLAENLDFDWELLQDLGFDEQWIKDPVRVQGSCEIYSGEYDNGQIDTEYYYNRLKPAFINEIENI